MASKYFTENELAQVIKEAKSGDGPAVPALGLAVDTAFDSFMQELVWRGRPRRIRHSLLAGRRGRPPRGKTVPPNRAPEDWFVQGLAMGAMEQLHRVPGSSHPSSAKDRDARTVGGPTVRLILAVANCLADKLESGEIRYVPLDGETRELGREAADRLRALTPGRIRYRLRKADMSGIKRRLNQAVPPAPTD
jgi:hypothetical protein